MTLLNGSLILQSSKIIWRRKTTIHRLATRALGVVRFLFQGLWLNVLLQLDPLLFAVNGNHDGLNVTTFFKRVLSHLALPVARLHLVLEVALAAFARRALRTLDHLDLLLVVVVQILHLLVHVRDLLQHEVLLLDQRQAEVLVGLGRVQIILLIELGHVAEQVCEVRLLDEVERALDMLVPRIDDLVQIFAVEMVEQLVVKHLAQLGLVFGFGFHFAYSYLLLLDTLVVDVGYTLVFAFFDLLEGLQVEFAFVVFFGG